MVIVALTALSGLIAGLYIGSWQAFVSELVPRDVLHNAVTLNSAQFSAARAFGPAVGGILLAWLGPSAAFFINALSFVAVIVALAAIRVDPVEETVTDRPHLLAELADTVRYVRRAPGITACMVVVLTLGFFGSPVFQFIVVFAEDVFEVGARAFGLLSASLGIGAILGTPFVAGRGARMPRHLLTGAAMVAYGSALLVFAFAPVYGVAVVGLLGAGAGYLAIASTLNTTIQLQVDERVRGKVLALYVMALTVSVPLGSLLQGWAAEAIGPRITVAVSGGAFLLVAFALRAKGSLLHMDDESAPRWIPPEMLPDPAA
jgi:predicted MFS family arabinose efflux permease